MVEVAIVGFGRIGMTIAFKLMREGYQIAIVDRDRETIGYIGEKYEKYLIDTSNYHDVEEKFPNADAAVIALPGKIAYKCIVNLLKKKINVIDVSFYSEEIWSLRKYLSGSKTIYIPDAGFAPGLSNILAARLDDLLDKAEKINIYVGGVSEKPDNFLGLALTWSPEDLLDEYIRPAKILRKGKVKYVDPLQYTGLIEIPGVGIMEYFASDGLRTLLKTMKHLQNMEELTLRYRGHMDKMKFLRDIGMLSDNYIDLNGFKVKSKSVLARFLVENIDNTYRDLVILYVSAEKDGVKKNYFISRRYNEDSKISAMSMVTGYTAATITKLYLEGLIEGEGIIPPEYIGVNPSLFRKFEEELLKENILLKIV